MRVKLSSIAIYTLRNRTNKRNYFLTVQAFNPSLKVVQVIKATKKQRRCSTMLSPSLSYSLSLPFERLPSRLVMNVIDIVYVCLSIFHKTYPNVFSSKTPHYLRPSLLLGAGGI